MPIEIRDLPDPSTPASRAAGKVTPLIESDASRQLVHELRRYCNGEVGGRSFLLAGHRGSGKTTLVFNAIEALSFEPDLLMQPLPVLLQGPTLLPNAREDLPLAMDGSGEAGRRLTEMENVLVQITLGLHRAVAREMIRAYRRHAERVGDRYPAERRELFELAAQLQIELDEYTGKARLREIWRRGRALPFGVLVTPLDLSLTGLQLREGPARHYDQGFRELVGLSSVCEAYRRISGKISRKDETKSGASERAERSLNVEAKGKELTGPLLAVVTGAAVGAGTLAAHGQPATAALAGLLTALGAMVVGKASFSRSRSRSASLEDLFIPDLSVATLDRILPVLIDRLRDAGLAPIFVVDELDKVERLSDRILEMIRRLKKLVAESACFCFLADRSYFEEMRQRTTRVAYSIEHTYFTHQLFIAFRHTDMRAHLERILSLPSPRPGVGPGDASEQRAARQIAEDVADGAVLPYILMHEAQMHPIDLARRLSQLRGADGNVGLEPGEIRTRVRYRLELIVQLAIELQLEQPAMQAELDRRPAFRRLAHDALYFVSREWERDVEHLTLADDAREDFARYLIRRMELEIRPGPRRRPDGDTPDAPLVGAEDLDFLWRSVRAMAGMLAAPADLQAQYQARGVTGVVADAIRSAVALGPLIEEISGRPGVYRWRFRRSGREILAAPVPPPMGPLPAEPPWMPLVRMLRGLEAALQAASDGRVDPSTLSSMLSILPTSPAWPSVSTALSRLETPAGGMTDDAQTEEDVAAVTAFAGLVQQSIVAVALALFCGRVLSAWSDESGEDRLLHALLHITEVLELAELSPDDVTAALGQLADQVSSTLTPMPVRPTVAPEDLPGVRTWIEWIQKLRDRVPVPTDRRPPLPTTAAAPAWEYWRERLQGRRPAVRVEALLCSLTVSGPFALLADSMSLYAWSRAFQLAVTRTEDPEVGGGVPPAWLALAALQQLGWSARLPALMRPTGSPPRLSLFGAKDMDEVELGTILGWKVPAAVSRGAAGVFIVSYENANSESWSPTTQQAALVLRSKQWASLQALWEPLGTEFLGRFAYDRVVVDMSHDKAAGRRGTRQRRLVESEPLPEEVPRTVLEYLASGARGKDLPSLLMLTDDWRGEIPQGLRLIGRPKSLDEFFGRLRLLTNA